MNQGDGTDRPLAVGMIGVGRFGAARRAMMRHAGVFKLVACHDRDEPALTAACREEGAQPSASVEELLATPGLEGLVISTGIDTHVPFAVAAMRAGLHVFVEKPLCGNLDEAQQMLAVRRGTGRVVGLGHTDHGPDPICTLIRQHLADGKLGTPVCYEENTSHSGGLVIKPGEWRGLRDRNPGGMLIQCGVHALHRLQHLFGPVCEVSAMMRYDAHPDTQTADAANVLLRHRGGLVGTLNCYHVTAYIHELRLFGTGGTLYIDTHANLAWYQERRINAMEERVPVALPSPGADHGVSNLLHWYRACRGQGEACPSLEDGIDAVLPVFAAEQSDESGRRVDVNALRQSLMDPR